jgi:transcriptional repressor NrdR
MVIKKDGRRTIFDKNKILNGIMKACEKRAVSIHRLEAAVAEIEKELRNTMEREVASEKIGEMVMQELKEIDQVAYVRFASVYRQFADIQNFMQELEFLMKGKPEK